MPNVEALLKVVEILESTPDEAVDLQNWTCGTTACAIGHAASHPWFIERGFKLDERYGYPVFHKVKGEKLQSWEGWEAVEEFFGLTGYKSNANNWLWGKVSSQEIEDIPPSIWLFNSECYPAGDKDYMPHKFSQKQQVINRIKEFVEHGI